MLENINELIEINLNLIYETKNKSIMRTSFKDINNKPLQNSVGFSEILNQKELVVFEKTQGFRCDLTEFGYKVCRQGGWLAYLEIEKTLNEHKKQKEFLEYEKLETELIVLKNQVKDYLFTKLTARVGFVIALISIIFQIVQWVLDM
jgi:hypothetical protein